MHRSGALLGLTIVALALGVIVAIDSPDAPSVANRRIVPEFDRGQLQAVIVTHADGHVLELRRTADGDFDIVGAHAVADDEAVAALFGTIDLLSYRRRARAADAPERGLGSPVAVVAIELTSGARVELGVGAAAGSGDLVWLSRADRADHYLIDGYAARALARRADELRSRRVFLADDVTGIEIYRGEETLVFSGRAPRTSVHLGGVARADAGVVFELVAMLRKLRIARFVDTAPDPESSRLSLRIAGGGGVQELAVFGDCPGAEAMRLVVSRVGPGCVDAAHIAALARPLDDRAGLIERRLIAGRIASITAGEVALTAAGSTWKLGDRRADPDAVDEWIDEVNRAATGATTTATGDAVFDIAIEYAGADPDVVHVMRSATELLARREGDTLSVVLRADAVLARPPEATRFRSRQIILEQSTAVRELVASAGNTTLEHLERGERISDWTVVAGKPTVITTAVRSARTELAQLRAERFLPGATTLTARRTVIVVFDPPPIGGSDQPVTRRIHVGPATDAGGCLARIDDDLAVFELGADACAGLLGPWTR